MNLDSVASSYVARSSSPTRLTAAQLENHPDYALVQQLENREIPPVLGLLAAPLVGREGRTMGVIYVSDKIAGEFSADDEAILVQLTQMASVAVENILSAEAREANRAKDQFIAVLSHELRTPLTPVLATIASMQSDNRLSNELQDDLKVIRRNVELEARLIDDLLDLTRISKGKIELQLEVVDANEILREAAGICRSDIAEKRIDLVLDMSAKHPWVKGDATRLQQVFWNLIKNAVKFTAPQGRIVLESYNSSDTEYCVKVSDTGIGIEAEILPRIFLAFEQGRSSITRQFGGLGLGLAISKALIEQHHGKLSASSSGRDKGATFVVAIPTTREPPQASAYRAPRLVHPAPSRVIRALLVEDHRDTARVMAKLLRGNGYSVETAATFTEAANLLKSKSYDVLVSDIGLPDGSGLDLMRHARASQNLVGIALSGFGMEHDIRRSKDAGFSVHLTKPLNFQLLIEAIDRLTVAAEEAAAKPAAG
jgi:signal transduction histidine kinase/ActR/RegA family two-component response regulator